MAHYGPFIDDLSITHDGFQHIVMYSYVSLPEGKRKFRAKGTAIINPESLLPSMNHPVNQPWFVGHGKA
jgi:hypothetical protein